MDGNAPIFSSSSFSMGGPSNQTIDPKNIQYQAPTGPMMGDNYNFSDADFANFASGSDFTNSGDSSTPLEFDFDQFNNVDNMFQEPQMPQEVMPMTQQPMQIQPAMPGTMVPMHLRQPQVPMQAPVPGMLHHPAVGWYYPAQPMMQPPTQQFQAPQQMMFTGGQMQQSSSSKKRKAGPPAVDIPDTLDISDDDENDGDGEFRPTKRSKPTRRINKQPIVTPTSAVAGQRKIPSIDQTCVCTSQPKKVPRPRNAFILYRIQMIKNITRSGPHGALAANDQSQISKRAGDAWRNESLDVKENFQRLAREESDRHKAQNPGYKYRPVRKGKKAGAGRRGDEDPGFGGPGCQCGAYLANVRKMRDAGFEVEGADAVLAKAEGAAMPAPMYGAPVPQGYAPVAQMQAYPGYGITPEQAAKNQTLISRFGKPPTVAAAAMPARRSSRHQIAVNYAEPPDAVNTDDDIEAQLQAAFSRVPDEDEIIVVPRPQQEGKAKTPRASLSQRRRSSVAPIQTPFSTGPSKNTRSSRSFSPEDFDLDTVQENPYDALTLDELFGDTSDLDFNATPLTDQELESIVAENAAANGRRRSSARVASRRSSSKSKTPSPRRSSPRTSPRRSGVEKRRTSVVTRSRRSSSAGLRRSPRQASPK